MCVCVCVYVHLHNIHFAAPLDLCVTLNSSSYEVEEGESAVVKVTLDKQITCPVSVMVMLVDGTAVGELSLKHQNTAFLYICIFLYNTAYACITLHIYACIKLNIYLRSTYACITLLMLV